MERHKLWDSPLSLKMQKTLLDLYYNMINTGGRITREYRLIELYHRGMVITTVVNPSGLIEDMYTAHIVTSRGIKYLQDSGKIYIMNDGKGVISVNVKT